MKKWIKIIASFLGILVLLIVFAGALLITFVNPNHFKPLIAKQVQKYTGRQLIIEGNLSWSFYPYFGIKVGRTELDNLPGYQQKIFAEWDSATVGVKLLPLLHSRIESSGIAVDGLTLYLIKKADGKNNWQDLKPVNNALVQSQPATQSVAAKTGMAIAINGVDVSNAKVYWVDEQTKQDIELDKLNIEAHHIVFDHAFPVSAGFHFSEKKSAVSGYVTIKSKVSFNLDNSSCRFKETDLSANIHQGDRNFKIESMANISADLTKEHIEFAHWRGRFADIKWSGKLAIQKLKSQPLVTGNLQTEPFSLQQVLTSIGETGDMPKATHMSANINFNFDTSKKSSQQFSFNGAVKSPDLQFKNIKATDLMAKTELQNGVLTIPSLSAVFYKGSLTSDVKIDLTHSTPQITFNAKLAHIQAEPFVADLNDNNQHVRLIGEGNIELHAVTSGLDKDKLLQNLNGNAQFSLDKGVLKGIDINYLAGTAYALAKRELASVDNTDQTPFGNIKGTAVIRNGIISNNDFLIDMPRYETKGKGTIDLANEKIDYMLNIKSKESPQAKKELANLYGLGIPVFVKGHLYHPSIGLDSLEMTKQIAKQQIEKVKEKAVKKIEEKLGVNLPKDGAELIKNLLS